uniref:BZIP domain-containing protein n=1 Tax=Caenorhabditis tropicalis TaxID=1561998 RepID=A0A1I7U246_9PELO
MPTEETTVGRDTSKEETDRRDWNPISIEIRFDCRYFVKRAKNNEAARKSRKLRKERETNAKNENDLLKIQLADLRQQLKNKTDECNNVMKERDYYKTEVQRLQTQYDQQRHPFRDLTNQLKYDGNQF